MEIFLSAETEGPAASKWFALQKEFMPLLKTLEQNDYGESLISIGIISILLREKYLEDGWHKERKYYSKKNRDADIRLKIDYAAFLRADEESTRNMFIEHILESISIAGKKAGKEFDVDRLLSDVRNLLK